MTAEREGLVALLAEHYPSGYVCGTDCDHPLNSPQGWAEHLADALADLLAARDRRVRAEGYREGYETARGDLVSGAFVGGPTYEALKASLAGRQIAKEALREAARDLPTWEAGNEVRAYTWLRDRADQIEAP